MTQQVVSSDIPNQATVRLGEVLESSMYETGSGRSRSTRRRPRLEIPSRGLPTIDVHWGAFPRGSYVASTRTPTAVCMRSATFWVWTPLAQRGGRAHGADRARRRRQGVRRRHRGRLATSTSTSATASSWSSSARRAAGRRPRCAWSPAWRTSARGTVRIGDRVVNRRRPEGPRHRDGLPELRALPAPDVPTTSPSA